MTRNLFALALHNGVFDTTCFIVDIFRFILRGAKIYRRLLQLINWWFLYINRLNVEPFYFNI